MDAQAVASDFHINVSHPTLQIALTGPSNADAEASTAGLNHPAVYMNLNGPPYPYSAKDWDAWFWMVSELWKYNLADLQEINNQDQSVVAAQDWSKRKWLGRQMWHSTIRDMGNGGKFIGDITVPRETFMYIRDEEERKRRKEENVKLEPGDPRIVWMIGFWLIPEYHRRGIMPAVLQTVMAEILPKHNAHTVHGSFFDHNTSSRKVFEKCGFSFQEVVPDAVIINPAKTNGIEKKVGTGRTKWERHSSS
ncbi:hypothetical protein H2200_007731 [Cladophialophora chaetospira]|uniref:N-acetyltransferase domain-containing protein n=1 Tax=Cladophialophora chaetospira TaxID=386627 RepID=A0AA38X6G1_9EURO|nr:hypothetical protein H2200_007731 [Cladophialophora chaetospira]